MTIATKVSFDLAAVEALSAKLGDPDWMKQLRLEAFQAFETLPLPAQNEDWRNLRLRHLSFADLTPHVETQGVPEALADRIEAGAAASLIHRNRSVVDVKLQDELKERGVIFTSLQEAIQNHPDLVKPYLTKLYGPDETLFSALHYALLSGGAFLYVPKNVEIVNPIQLFTYLDERNSGAFNHTLVIADKFSKVTLLDLEASSGNCGNSIRSAAVEVFALDGAKVTYVSLQNFEGDVSNFNIRRAHVGRDADVKWVISEMGAHLSRSENTSYVEGEGGNSDSIVVFFGSNDQTLDVSAGMVHTGKHGSSDIVAKGVMTDMAKTIWRGLGHIKQGAIGSKTFQRENSLILSDDAKGDAIPALLIQETEVAGAGHAATVGKIDEQHLFYLMSRGISESQAIQMIVEGFFTPVVEQIPFETIRNQVQSLIDSKLGL